MNKSQTRGFTLIELMIVIAIVGILAAIAYPAYQDQVRKSRRADAKQALASAANAMERFFTLNGNYTGAALGAGGVYPNVVPTDGTGTTYYNLSLPPLLHTANTFTLNAAPTGPQNDPLCETLTLAHTGQKGKGGTGSLADCW